MPRRYLTVMNLLWGAGALPLIAMGLATSLWQVILSAAVLGVAFGMGTVIWGTLLQRRVPSELLGRVSSLDFFVSLALMPVSMALAGPLAHWIGITPTFVLAGVLPVIAAVLAVVLAKLPEDELAHPLR
jgi:MFS family permease